MIELTSEHYDLAKKIARSLYYRCNRRVFSWEDVISDAYYSLYLASKSYNPAKNISFTAWAIVTMKFDHLDRYHEKIKKKYVDGKQVKNVPIVWVEYDKEYLTFDSALDTRISVRQVMAKFKKCHSKLKCDRADLLVSDNLSCGETAKSLFIKELREFFIKHGYSASTNPR